MCKYRFLQVATDYYMLLQLTKGFNFHSVIPLGNPSGSGHTLPYIPPLVLIWIQYNPPFQRLADMDPLL